jgi:hypothetical protein
VATGYQVYVYHRATSADAWGIGVLAAGTVNVTGVFDAISVTAPAAGTTVRTQGSNASVTWTANTSVASGEFGIWLVSTGGSWYLGKVVAANGASYVDSVELNVPVADGYQVYVYYRTASGDPWGIYGLAPGTVNVTP